MRLMVVVALAALLIACSKPAPQAKPAPNVPPTAAEFLSKVDQIQTGVVPEEFSSIRYRLLSDFLERWPKRRSDRARLLETLREIKRQRYEYQTSAAEYRRRAAAIRNLPQPADAAARGIQIDTNRFDDLLANMYEHLVPIGDNVDERGRQDDPETSQALYENCDTVAMIYRDFAAVNERLKRNRKSEL